MQDSSRQPNMSLPPDSSRKRNLIILSLLGVLLLVGLGLAIYYFNQPVKVDNDTPNPTPATKKEVSLTEVESTLKEVSAGYAITTETATTETFFAYSGRSDGYLSTIDEGAKYLDAKQSFNLSELNTLTDVSTRTIDALKKKGMDVTESSSASSDEHTKGTQLVSTNLTCDVTTMSMNSVSYDLEVRCAAISDFAKNAATMKPYIDAYAKDASNPQKSLMFMTSRMDVKDSKSTGYQIAAISTGEHFAMVGGSIALFYKTPDGTWHYFLNSQSDLGCEAYKTNDLKKAFLGETCTTANGAQSAVAL